MSQKINPFLLDMPMVTIFKNVKHVNGERVESSNNNSKRIWYRICKAKRYGDHDIDAVTRLGNKRLVPDPMQRNKKEEY